MLFVQRLGLISRQSLKGSRFYSLKAKVGDRFQSKKEVLEYLQKETWSVDKYLADSDDQSLLLPSVGEVRKLLKLSGLPIEGNDLERIRERLGKQLGFISKLHRIEIEEENSVEETQARLMPRNEVPLSYDDLLDKINEQRKDPELGEVEGSWDATGLAQMEDNKYFVVRGGLMQNRD